VYIKNTPLHKFPPKQMHDEQWIKRYFFLNEDESEHGKYISFRAITLMFTSTLRNRSIYT